jgi:hypothetical protein
MMITMAQMTMIMAVITLSCPIQFIRVCKTRGYIQPNIAAAEGLLPVYSLSKQTLLHEEIAKLVINITLQMKFI